MPKCIQLTPNVTTTNAPIAIVNITVITGSSAAGPVVISTGVSRTASLAEVKASSAQAGALANKEPEPTNADFCKFPSSVLALPLGFCARTTVEEDCLRDENLHVI